jgi:hypothetical protein
MKLEIIEEVLPGSDIVEEIVVVSLTIVESAGPQGEQGIQGIQGIQGEQGTQGIPGEPGIGFNILDPTVGNIPRANGTGYESINEVEFLQNKDAFSKSYLEAKNNGSTTIAWDSFVRPENPVVGNADSGQIWTTLFGTGWRIISTNALNNNSLSASVIYLNLSSQVSIRGYQMKAQLSGRASENNSCAFWWGKDVDNNFRLHVVRDRVILIRTISGVATITWNHLWTLPSGVTGIQSAFQEIEVNFFFRTPIFNQTFITVRNNEFGQNSGFDLTAFHTNFVTTADIGLVGFYSVGNFNDNIANFSVTNKG